MSTSPERIAYTASEVAEMLGLSEVQVRRDTKALLLPCRRFGRAVRYTRDDIESYLTRMKHVRDE